MTPIVPSTIPIMKKNCSYYTILNNCVFLNLTNDEIYSKLIKDIVSTFPENGKNIIIAGKNGYNFKVTSSSNEAKRHIKHNDNNSVIDLGECENTLKRIYDIDSLIILKYEKLGSSAIESSIQYEVYHPFTHEKLDLSYCENN